MMRNRKVSVFMPNGLNISIKEWVELMFFYKRQKSTFGKCALASINKKKPNFFEKTKLH